jgi:5'-3' exonuclease
MPASRTQYLVDASIYVFRAWFSMPDSMTDARGWPVNAVYGYTSFLCQLIEQHRPEYMAIAFDESLTSCFRNEIYPDYKANREPAPEELKRQFALCRQVSELLGVSCYSDKRYEADDLIGTLAHKMRKQNFKSVIVSGDKDLAQLLQRGDQLFDFAKDNRYGHSHIREKFGVKPAQMVDLLALAGDAVDNIPGVPGIGKKTAVALLEKFSSLEKLYNSLHRIESLDLRGSKRIRSLLEEHEALAFLSQELATISCNAPVKAGVRLLRRQSPDYKALDRLFKGLSFGDRIRQRIRDLPG